MSPVPTRPFDAPVVGGGLHGCMVALTLARAAMSPVPTRPFDAPVVGGGLHGCMVALILAAPP